MRMVLSLDSWPAMREAADSGHSELMAAASLAEIAGVDTLRLSINDELMPVREVDVDALRRAARRVELRMPISPSLLKIPLEARPDRVVIVGTKHDNFGHAPPVDARIAEDLGTMLRSCEDAGIKTSVRVAPELDAVRAVHAEGVKDVELFTGYIVDLPEEERGAALLALGDAARLASKLRMTFAVAGGLDDRNAREVLAAAPSADRVVLGRGLARRALLTGLDRAIRDFSERMR